MTMSIFPPLIHSMNSHYQVLERFDPDRNYKIKITPRFLKFFSLLKEGDMISPIDYAHGLGATGLTFYDDQVTDFFSPHAKGKSVMFMVVIGKKV